MTDTRSQNTAVKVRTQFGVIHLHLDFDEQLRVSGVSYKANDDKITPDTQIGHFLEQVLDGINSGITAKNEDWSHKWDLEKVGAATGGRGC